MEKRAIDFISDSIYKDDLSFHLGYGVHLLADKLWFVSVFNNGMKAYDDDPNPVKYYASAYYNDTDSIDHELYNTLRYRENIWDLLQGTKPLAFKDLLTAREVDRWKIRTLNWYDNKDKKYQPVKYITMDDIEEFIQSSSLKITNILDSIM